MRVLVRVGIALVAVFIVLAGSVFVLSQKRIGAKFDVPSWRGQAPEASDEVLAKGRHVAIVRGCLECHKANGAGGLFTDAMPVMRLVPRNITPAGAAKGYRDADWERAIRHCVRPDGQGIPFMPCLDNAHLSDEDLGLLITYLRSLKAVPSEDGRTEIGPVGRVLFLLGQLPYLHAELIDHRAAPKPAPVAGPTAEYGAYLGETCVGCHGLQMSGGPIPGVPPDWPVAANLTPHATGLKGWTKEQFLKVMREGKRPDGRQIDAQYMPWKQFASFSDDEATALWLYLQTLSAREKGGR